MLARLTGATEREALADVDIVVEAIAEDLAIKQELFRDLDRICKPAPSSRRRPPRCRSSTAPR
jgi:3-hydroxybutyryl-CoA dehydrogenase